MASLFLPDIFRNVTNFTLGLGTEILTAATSPSVTSSGYLSSAVSPDDANTHMGTVRAVEAEENVTTVSAVPASLKTTRLVVQSFLTPIVVTIGLFGNLLNILVLFQVIY
ncbi:hypothetical protein ElyMa_001932800 [Elysia marginata]|uniref:G-protein coupled receptors family 1 profile domain-containing protein n=1 Tax=Elysia marginata TaxID=1093978 RepID=A0AAV4EVM5_9GAST|nr:hypothetical protein ElyMa_001932800 [Elysia marginata]